MRKPRSLTARASTPNGPAMVVAIAAVVTLTSCAVGTTPGPAASDQPTPSASAPRIDATESGSAGPTPAATIGPAGEAGITGRTVIRGPCPVYSDISPCPDQPVPARITVTRPGATSAVAQLFTDAQGRFRVTLPPGGYVLQATNLTGGPRSISTPMEVAVTEDRYTVIVVPFSSVLEPGPGS